MISEQTNTCTVENCDIFDFMAKYVGLTVLHPGGFWATKKLAASCQINKDTKVLDIACGKGTTSILLAKEFGCRVEGIDISEDLVEEAKRIASRERMSDMVNFRVGDAMSLPFSENEFDVTVAQAMLILVNDKKKTIQEARRVIKPGGHAGWLELSWKTQPGQEFMDAVSNEICAYCMTNVLTFENWEKLFSDAGFSKVDVVKSSMEMSGMKGMIRDEGLRTTLKVMSKYLFNKRVKKRMKNLNAFINNNPKYFGYGIYITRK